MAYEGAEHEVVVVGHGGEVEDGGFVGVAGVFDDEVLDSETVIWCSCYAIRPRVFHVFELAVPWVIALSSLTRYSWY